MSVPMRSVQAAGSSLCVVDVGAPLRALPHLYGRCASAVAQEVADVILVDLYKADLQEARCMLSA